MHVGWHVEPEANVDVQVPAAPFVGAVDASQGLGEHVAAVRAPARHVDFPETV